MTTVDDGAAKKDEARAHPPLDIADDDDATAPLTQSTRLGDDEPLRSSRPQTAAAETGGRAGASETPPTPTAEAAQEPSLEDAASDTPVSEASPSEGSSNERQAAEEPGAEETASDANDDKPAGQAGGAVPDADPVPDIGMADIGTESSDNAGRRTIAQETAIARAEAARAKPRKLRKTSAPKRIPVPVGDVLRDRYEILEVIGLGGMSTVYRALDRFRARARSPYAQVALKVVNVSSDLGHDAVELMHREARRMQELVHSHIVRVYDWDHDPESETDFIIMELLEGKTLAKILKSSEDGTLAFPRALHIIEAVGSALRHAHARDVIHTDIKPGNIFVTRTGDVKVLDFGTARRLNPFPGGEDDPTVIYLDRVGALTPAYASLEMLKGEDPTPMDDVYGLGVLAYMMLAGRHPYDKKSAEDALEEKLKPEKPKNLAKWRWPALRRALQLTQDERTATITEFIEGFSRKPWWRIIG